MDINYDTNEVSLKVVFYGPGLSGKTTTLEVIHNKVSKNNRGRLTSIATHQDRTLFFDFMPLDLGKVGNLKVKLRLFTVPGQVYYNSTRKLVLKRVDGIIFIADSQIHRLEENIESLQNLEENLKEDGIDINNIPLILQYNKRDLPEILSIGELNAALNCELNVPVFPSVALTGEGVFPSLKAIAKLVTKSVEKLAFNSGKLPQKSNFSNGNKPVKKQTERNLPPIPPRAGRNFPSSTPLPPSFRKNKNLDMETKRRRALKLPGNHKENETNEW